ncbi:hypothetical protein [Gaetbulibacter jejuensis]|uniref:hypothetical protein n=1 Tax=Gaetbulibacter jejuensis TaxID=584607 RepID=UPI00300A041D
MLKKHSYLILSSILIILIISWFLLISDGNYGTTLFFSIPASIGFVIGYLQKYHGMTDTKLKVIIKGFFKIMLIVFAIAGILILIGMEGAICILMAYPFLVIPMFVAYVLGAFIGKVDGKNNINSILFIVILNPTTYIYDNYTEPINNIVKTEIIINTSAENIWKNLTSQIAFKDKANLLFEKGVTCPSFIEFDKANLNYSCRTNNDTIKLKIIEFVHNEKIKFILEKQTIPMKEITPYKSIDAKHLHNYFNINYGEITLSKIGSEKTKIVSTTSYNYKIAPKWYWELWSNYIINEMHLHVLNSIKNKYDFKEY